jgi:hypothetical protein
MHSVISLLPGIKHSGECYRYYCHSRAYKDKGTNDSCSLLAPIASAGSVPSIYTAALCFIILLLLGQLNGKNLLMHALLAHAWREIVPGAHRTPHTGPELALFAIPGCATEYCNNKEAVIIAIDGNERCTVNII